MNEITQEERSALELQVAHALSQAWKEGSRFMDPAQADQYAFFDFIERFFGWEVSHNVGLMNKALKLAGYWVEEEVAVSH